MAAINIPAHGMELMPLSRRQYDGMISAGILTKEDKVELINGELVKKMPIGTKHSRMVNALVNRLCQKLGDLAIVAAQNPVALHEYSEPEPDVAVIRPPDSVYEDRHPEPADIFFLIEVADTSVRFDRDSKVPLYAACDITECWLVDINEKTITVFTKPDGTKYRQRTDFKSGDTIALQAFPGIGISLAELGW